MIDAIFAVLFCSMLMRMKGGGIIDPKADGKLCSTICFSVLVFGLTGQPVLALFAGGAWLAGCAPAIKQYLTNLGGYKGPLSFYGMGEYRIINLIVEKLAQAYYHFRPLTENGLRQFSGWVGTALRGLAMGIPLAFVFGWPFVFVGLAMAPAYYIGISLRQQELGGTTIDGWHYGEWIWGGVIGLAVAFWLSQGGNTWSDF